jgi:hypothetical protein
MDFTDEINKHDCMKKAPIILCLILPLLGLALLPLCGCDKIKTAIETSEIDFGTITNSVYQNNYFGLSVTFPPDWSIQDQAEQRRLAAEGNKILNGNDPNKQAVLKASELQTVNMFAVFEHAIGSPVPFNPSVISMAENVSAYPGIKTGSDYLYHVKQQLSSGRVEVAFPKDVYTTQLGGKDFDVMQTSITLGDKTVQQKYYVSVMKGYALAFIASYTTDEEAAKLQKILDSVTFK